MDGTRRTWTREKKSDGLGRKVYLLGHSLKKKKKKNFKMVILTSKLANISSLKL